MTTYKLYYFDLEALAEVSRLLFVLAGQEFEDIRWSREDWPKFKPDAPFGQCPWLEVTKDGKTVKIAQSAAIACYLAREFGYYGKSNLESAIIDQVIGIFKDLTIVWHPVFYVDDEEKKAEILKKLQEEHFPVFFGHYDKLLKQNGYNGHFIGDSITLADIYVYDAMSRLKKHNCDPTLQFPELRKLQQRVEANPKIKNYLPTKKNTDL